MKKKKNSFLVWLLAAVLAVGMMPASALPSFAGDEVNVSTAAELKAALGSEGDKTVKLTADVLYDLSKHIEVKGNKTLELDGHKIMLNNNCSFSVPTGADLKVDGKADGSEIKSVHTIIFIMKGGSLTIDWGRYIVSSPSTLNIVWIHDTVAGGKIEINGGYFQSDDAVIRSQSEQAANPPEIVINGGTFISNKSSVWESLNKDVTKGTVNGGSFHGGGGTAFNFGDTGKKSLGTGKYLVMDGEHKDDPNLWHLKGTFIQVGNAANDFVNVTMKAAAGGRGYFFRVAYNKNPVLAMKNGILPVVAVPEAGKILSAWKRDSGDGSFVDPSLVRAYYIPKTDSTLEPDFVAAPIKPKLKIRGIYIYNGTEQTAEVTGYKPATMRIEGNKRVNAGTYTISVTPKGPTWNDETAEPATVEWTINKANCTGVPTCTMITEAGKTLADATLNINTISPAGGFIKWDLPLATAVTQGTAYAWTYIPDDDNYKKLTGTLIPWPVPENVSTAEELKAALEAEGNKIVKLTADVFYGLNKQIAVKGNKVLKLNGHKIMLSNHHFYVPTGADLKVDGKVDGSEIKSSEVMMFAMDGGSLTIEEGRYIVRENSANVVWVSNNAAGGRIEIDDGYFQSIRGNVIPAGDRKSVV